MSFLYRHYDLQIPNHIPFFYVTAFIVEVMDLLSCVIYLILTFTALISTFIPFLHQLSLHGKSRMLYFSSSNIQSNSKIRRVGPHHSWFQIHKSRFSHFYLLGIIVSVSLLLLMFLLLQSQQENSKSNFSVTAHFNLSYISFTLLILHLIRRYYECLFVHIWSETSYMHTCGYLLGLCHYLLLPFVFINFTVDVANSHSSFITSTLFNQYNLFQDSTCSSIHVNRLTSIAGHFKTYHSGNYHVFWIVIGISLNILGQVEQYLHHRILARCRQRSRFEDPKSSPYGIPTGRGFHYLTCPHYLAEIMIYLSFFILCYHQQPRLSSSSSLSHEYMDPFLRCLEESSSTYPRAKVVLLKAIQKLHQFGYYIYPYKSSALFLWVIVNLAISAQTQHKYYLDSFKSKYPTNRKILIPFLW